jgi:pimeloyl-ACP methyl ester carboxylesterase
MSLNTVDALESTQQNNATQTPDITGQWQGSVEGTEKEERVALKIWKENGSWAALFFNILSAGDRRRVSPIILKGSTLKFSAAGLHYEGEVSADGNSIHGFRTVLHTRPLNFERVPLETAWPLCTSPHTAQFVEVEDDVRLEVLEWGGTGRPLVLLAGLGHTAHIYDKFAPKLAAKYRVYGITRRGIGESSSPIPDRENYSSDRLGDDVLAVLDALKIERPVLVGHSYAGAEISSIASRYPEKAAGLVYLDAAFEFAFYDDALGNLYMDAIHLRRLLEKVSVLREPRELKPLVREILQQGIPQIERHLQEMHTVLEAMAEPESKNKANNSAESHVTVKPAAMPSQMRAIKAGVRKYTEINCPTLAVYADRTNFNGMYKDDPAARAAAEAIFIQRKRAQMDAFEAGVPQARVVRLADADHAVFRSNEAEVLREIDAFVATLA